MLRVLTLVPISLAALFAPHHNSSPRFLIDQPLPFTTSPRGENPSLSEQHPPADTDINPVAVLAQAASVTLREERQRIQATLCRRLAINNPAAAADLAVSLGLEESEDDVLVDLVSSWANDAPSAALDWIYAQSSPAVRSRCLLSLVQLLVLCSASSEAAYLIDTNMPSGPEKAHATLILASAWASRDFDAAIAWVVHIPNDALRASAISACARHSPVSK